MTDLTLVHLSETGSWIMIGQIDREKIKLLVCSTVHFCLWHDKCSGDFTLVIALRFTRIFTGKVTCSVFPYFIPVRFQTYFCLRTMLHLIFLSWFSGLDVKYTQFWKASAIATWRWRFQSDIAYGKQYFEIVSLNWPFKSQTEIDISWWWNVRKMW